MRADKRIRFRELLEARVKACKEYERNAHDYGDRELEDLYKMQSLWVEAILSLFEAWEEGAAN